MFNWLECDAYVYNFPEKSGMASNGATYYEVLTSDINLTWKKASDLQNEGIEANMVITGVYQNSEKTFHGLCR